MTADLIAGGVILAGVAGFVFWLWRAAKRSERGRAAEASNAVKDRQLQHAADAPKSKDALVDEIRKRGF